FGLIPLLGTIYLWRAIYAGKPNDPEVAGYTLAGVISYFLLVPVVDMLTAVTDDDWQIAGDIREGNINQFLLKPIDYLTYRLCLFGANRVIYTSLAIIPVIVFIWIERRYFVVPSTLSAMVGFALSVVLTGLLQFLMSYSMAL